MSLKSLFFNLVPVFLKRFSLVLYVVTLFSYARYWWCVLNLVSDDGELNNAYIVEDC